jgi:plasminogen activator inhibitor 1 RNA-binding protein
MADVRSKNLYELLGNDPELDSDREPEPPTKTIDKPAQRHGKRDAPKEAPSAAPTPTAPRGGARGGRGGREGGNEGAFRDRNAGSYNNRNRPVDEVKEAGRRGYRGRDDRGARTRTDRHPVRTAHTDTEKQVGQGWGAKKGDAEWNDEKAGEAIAKAEEAEPQTPLESGEAAAIEEADKAKSYADYLAEQAAKGRGELGVKEARAPNAGGKDKKWQAAKELKRDGEEEDYIKPQEEKGKRERQRKEKNFLEVDMRFVEQPRGRGNGPRGSSGRGGRGRGGRGDGPRREGGGRGGAPAGPTVQVDEKNFPSLGGK